MWLLQYVLSCCLFACCCGATSIIEEHPNAKLLGQLVYSDLSVHIDQESSKSVMDNFEDGLGILMNVYWKDDHRKGLGSTIPITLELKNQPALIVLERIVAQLDPDGNATWQLRHGALEVGLKSQLASRGRQRLETYYIRDLLFTIRNFEAPALDTSTGGGGGNRGGGGSGGGNQGGGIGGGTPDPPQEDEIEKIIELIVKFIEPDLWEQNGGPCSITNYKMTLLIRAPDFMHRQINGYPFLARQPNDVRARRVLYAENQTRVIVDRLPIR